MAQNGENPTWHRWNEDTSVTCGPREQAVMALAADVPAEPSGAGNVLAEYADTGDFWDIGTMQTSYTHHRMSVLGERPGSDPSSGTYRCYFHDHPEQMRSICGGRQALRSNAERLGSTRALRR